MGFKHPQIQIALDWFDQRNWQAFPFQLEAWEAYLDGYHGMVNAPTGSGKTYSMFIGACLQFIKDHPDYTTKANKLPQTKNDAYI